MLARSLNDKSPLSMLIGTQVSHIIDMVRSIWTKCDENLSVVVTDRQRKCAVAAALVVDIKINAEATGYYQEMAHLLEAVAKPVKYDLLKNGGNWVELVLAGCDVALPDDNTILLIEMMAHRVFELARDHCYDGVVTISANPTIAVSLSIFFEH